MHTPPKLPLRLLRWLCRNSRLEEIEGDLHEDFQINIEKKGIRKAKISYYWTLIRSIRPHLFKKDKRSNSNITAMLLYQLQMAFRHLKKHKSYTAINIIGLVSGLSIVAIIALFVADIKSSDSHIAGKDRIFRLEQATNQNNQNVRRADLHQSIAPTLAADLPEIEAFTRLIPSSKTIGIINENKTHLHEESFLFVDKGFLTVFGLEVLNGDINELFEDKNSIFLSQSTAVKLFGHTDVIGETLVSPKSKDFLFVSGVLKDPPVNASIQYRIIGNTLNYFGGQETVSFEQSFAANTPIYLKLKTPETTGLEKKIKKSLEAATDRESISGATYFLNSFENLKSDLAVNDDIITPIDSKVTLMFIVIAVLLLTLVVTNYINLSTARILQRSKEVGIRKVIGAKRSSIALQSFLEAFLTCLIAMPFTVVLLEVFTPFFESLIEHELFMDYKSNWHFLLVLVSTPFTLAVLAGAYPSILISRLKFKQLEHTNNNQLLKGKWLRKGLVIFQFSFSIALMLGAVFIQNQMDFIQQKTTSFEPENIIVLKGRYNLFTKQGDVLKSEFKNIPGVIEVSYTSNTPGDNFFGTSESPEIEFPYTRFHVDHDYLDVFNIEFLEGKNFSQHSDSVRSEVIINKKMQKLLEAQSPEKTSYFNFMPGSQSKVIGVVEDFHFKSLHSEVEPTVFIRGDAMPFALNKAIVKVNTKDLAKTVTSMEEVWNEFFPEDLFSYQFLDKKLENLYTSEKRLSGLFNVFTFVAILISCLGLFGLTKYAVQVKMKEISIRKVMGAKVAHILRVLSSDMLSSLLLASTIAIPSAIYFINQWLNGFSYHIDIRFSIIFTTVIVALLIAAVTIGYEVVKAASKNPVDTLKDE